MTKLLYQEDSYLKEFTAKVLDIEGNKVVLDKTAFHPRSGGLDCDTGYIITPSGTKIRVTEVIFDKDAGDVIHVLEKQSPELRAGDEIKGVIDWDRRYRMMRLHTAAHIISAIMYRDHGAKITGGHITPEKGYDDYDLDVFDPQIFAEAINKANDVVKQGIEVKIYWMRREEALKVPGIVKLASRMPPNVAKLRIVEIPGIDIQADGGPHVRNTAEIGRIVFLKAVNKGKKRKRVYYTVEP